MHEIFHNIGLCPDHPFFLTFINHLTYVCNYIAATAAKIR